MRISGDDADKLVGAFSGGERRRIMLAALMARSADILLLDEPTNDLDIASRDALESVLAEYEGLLVVVSHDRYLLDRLCDRVLWIEEGTWGVLDGGYEAYEIAQRERERAALGDAREERERRPKSSKLTPLKQRSQIQTQVARFEREIEKIDSRRAAIEALFADPGVYSDHVRVQEPHTEMRTLTQAAARATDEWEKLVTELEKLD